MSPVVGREEELDLIRHRLADAVDGRGSCLCVLGEVGLGKTRLTREARSLGEEAGMTVLHATSPGIGGPARFEVLARLLRSWTRSAEVRDDEIRGFGAGLRQILPEWTATPSSPELPEDQIRLLAFEGAFRLVRFAARSGGAVLICDDLHDADAETVGFVAHIAPDLRDAGVMVLATVRTPEGEQLAAQVRDLERDGHAEVVELAPLETDEIDSMIAGVLGAEPPEGLAAELAMRSEGVPLLVEELLDFHVKTGALRRDRGQMRWSGVGEASVPPSIVEMVGQKVHGLSWPSRSLVEAVAVLGYPRQDVLALMTDLTPAGLSAAAAEAAASGLLEVGAGEIRFRHGLFREVVAQEQLTLQRRVAHLRAAAAIERLDGDDPAALLARAHHLAAADERDGAARLLMMLARQHRLAGALLAAEDALRRVLDLGAAPDITQDAVAKLAETTAELGRFHESLELDRRETQLRGDQPDRLARMADSALRMRRLDEASELIERAQGVGADRDRVHVLRATLLLYQGEFARALQEAGRVLEREGAPPQVTSGALMVAGQCHLAQGRHAEAAVLLRRWAEVAGDAGLSSSRVDALCQVGQVEFLAGDPPEGLRAAADLAKQIGAFPTSMHADMQLAWWHGARGEVDEAVARAEGAAETARRFRLFFAPLTLLPLAWARSLRRPGEGEPLVATCLRSIDDPNAPLIAGSIRGEWAVRLGDYDAAVRHLTGSLTVIRQFPSGAAVSSPFMLVCALAAAGRDRQAATTLEKVTPLARTYMHRLWLGVATALVRRSAEALDEAAADQRAPYFRAQGLLLGADVIGGDAAAGWLRDALRFFSEHGLESDASRARRLLRARGEPVPRARPKIATLPAILRAAGVTPREAEILALVQQRLSNEEIARRLFLSVRTVESHVSSLLRKFGVDQRGALIAVSATAPG